MRNRASDRHDLLRWCSVCLCLVLLLPEPAAAQTFFEDVTEEAIEVAALFETQSIAFGDYDNDGWVDLFLSEYFGANRILLLHNEGKGRFVDRTVAIQADILPNAKGGGGIFGDYDNDGDLDLFVPIQRVGNGCRSPWIL